MDRHKFEVGQIVDFDSRHMPMPKRSGPFEVMRVLPAGDGYPQTYRIKSKTEPFERSAEEFEIVAVDPPVEKQANAGRRLRTGPTKVSRPVRPH
jgi:hypothetical protein